MKVALVGNQNSGKTSLFNILTGSNQKVGNWPGVTIEKKTGVIRKTGDEIVDLPGIYSLSPYSLEENVSRKYLLEEKPDLIINIIDATTLERGLYLTTQLLELEIDVVIALNMMDILEKEGTTIDIEKLSNALNTTIIPISAKKRIGIDRLADIVCCQEFKKNSQETLNFYPKDVMSTLKAIRANTISQFEGVKVFERDLQFATEAVPYESKIKVLEKKYEMDSEELIADQRYHYIESVLRDALTVEKKKPESFSSKLDKVLLNKWACFPIFILIMAFVYFIAVGLMGTIPLGFIDALFNGTEETASGIVGLSFNFGFIGISEEVFELVIPWDFQGLSALTNNGLQTAGAAPWAASLVSDGIIGGLGAILTFTPQLLMLFFFLGLLESSGYMSRVAFALDRVFRKFGLNGQSIIPFIVGTGCSVPGIAASKTIEDQDERKITAITTSFMPCGAKLPIIAMIVSAFWPSFGWLISLSMYLLAIVVILAVSIFLKKVVLKVKEEKSSYISELPTYKAPMMSYVFRDTAVRIWDFIKKAGTIILVSTMLIWFLASFTWDYRWVDGDMVTISESMLAGIGNGLSWLFVPMMSSSMVYGGAGYTDLWGITVSAIEGLIAKENVVTSLSTIAGLADGVGTEMMFAPGMMFGYMNGWTAFAFMTFNLFSTPCFAALGALKKELNNTKQFITAIGIQLGFAWLLSALIGTIGLGASAISHAIAG